MTECTDHFDRFKAQSRIFAKKINSIPIDEFLHLRKSTGTDMYCCPVCGSGTGSHRTGALKVKWQYNSCICYAGGCPLGGKLHDNLDVYMVMTGKGYKEALEDLGFVPDYTGEFYPQSVQIRADRQMEKLKQNAKIVDEQKYLLTDCDYLQQYKQWNSSLLADGYAMKYLFDRGVDVLTAAHFLIGYCAEWSHPKHPEFTSKRIIIPSNRYSYVARRIDGYDYAKKLCVGSSNAIFNPKAMDDEHDERPIIVTAGQFDCMVIWQKGFRCVSINSDANVPYFADVAENRNPCGVYVLCMDNDESGIKAMEQLYSMLKERHIVAYMADVAWLYAGKKDANEAYVADANGFTDRLMTFVADCMKRGEDNVCY